jgi:hypothetical protein
LKGGKGGDPIDQTTPTTTGEIEREGGSLTRESAAAELEILDLCQQWLTVARLAQQLAARQWDIERDESRSTRGDDAQGRCEVEEGLDRRLRGEHELVQRILSLRSASPITLTAKLHIGLAFSDPVSREDLTCRALVSVIDDLIPAIPDDMAAVLTGDLQELRGSGF